MIDEENQTQFAQDEPLMEAQTVVRDELALDPLLIAKQQKRSRLIKVGVGIFALLFVSLLVVAVSMPKQTFNVVATPSPTPLTEEAKKQSELDNTLNLLHEDITKADPSINDLPIPPIDFTLTLEEN